MGRQYFKFVILKAAVVHLVCQLTGLPYVQADKISSATGLSVSDFRKDKKNIIKLWTYVVVLFVF